MKIDKKQIYKLTLSCNDDEVTLNVIGNKVVPILQWYERLPLDDKQIQQFGAYIDSQPIEQIISNDELTLF